MIDAAVAAYYLRDCDPPAEPARDYVLASEVDGVRVDYWSPRLPPQPDWAALAASPEYAEWLRTHGGDPAATLAREAAERILAPSTPTEMGVDKSFVGLIGAVLNPLIARVNTLSAAASPSLPPLDLIDPAAARQYAAALAAGLSPMAREGE